jgi:hypothetical protein
VAGLQPADLLPLQPEAVQQLRREAGVVLLLEDGEAPPLLRAGGNDTIKMIGETKRSYLTPTRLKTTMMMITLWMVVLRQIGTGSGRGTGTGWGVMMMRKGRRMRKRVIGRRYLPNC